MRTPTEPLTEEAAIALLRERGVASAVVLFNGGNDEGGSDSITLHDEEGQRLDSISEHYNWDKEKKEYTQNEDTRIGEVLCRPVYERYHTFAGEFYVSGEVTWNMLTGKWVMEEDYQRMEDRYDDEGGGW